jgi:hypothetical protein
MLVTELLGLLCELGAWVGGAANRSESFAWFRVQGHLGVWGLLLAAVVGVVWMRLQRLPPAWIGALGLHLWLFRGVAQGQPDTVTYFTLAQQVARAPVQSAMHWPAVAWVGEEARFHHAFPGVPFVYGLAFRIFGESTAVVDAVLTGWAVLLPIVVGWAARGWGPSGPATERASALAAWGVVLFPLLQGQSGWMLVDLPFCVALAFAWGAMVRARRPSGVALALLACVPALSMKVSAPLFLVGPVLALLRTRRGFLATVLGLGMVALLLHPPRLRAVDISTGAALSLLIQLRPALWVIAMPAVRRAWRPGEGKGARVLAGALLALPALILVAPAEHAARYGLPLGALLVLSAARVSPRVSRFVTGSGLVLLIGGYAPVVRYHQGVNLQAATMALVADGVTAIDVVADAPGTTFPPAALAALVDVYAPVPVRTGAALALAPPDAKRHWWEFVEAPAWRQAGPADGLVLCLYGAGPEHFERENPQWERVVAVSTYRSSSFLLPREVVAYRRVQAPQE